MTFFVAFHIRGHDFFQAVSYGVMTFLRCVFDFFYTIPLYGHDFFRLTLYGVMTFFLLTGIRGQDFFRWDFVPNTDTGYQ